MTDVRLRYWLFHDPLWKNRTNGIFELKVKSIQIHLMGLPISLEDENSNRPTSWL